MSYIKDPLISAPCSILQVSAEGLEQKGTKIEAQHCVSIQMTQFHLASKLQCLRFETIKRDSLYLHSFNFSY